MEKLINRLVDYRNSRLLQPWCLLIGSVMNKPSGLSSSAAFPVPDVAFMDFMRLHVAAAS